MTDSYLALASVAAALWGAGRSIGWVFGESATAKRELRRLPLVRIADLGRGPAHIVGRVVADGPLVTAPLTGRRCVAHLTTLSSVASRTRRRIVVRQPAAEQRFVVDDGTGRAVVAVPPPPPEPLPGDDYDYEILCSFPQLHRETAGWVRRAPAVARLIEQWNFRTPDVGHVVATEGILLPGDAVIIGGYATSAVDPAGAAPPYRAPPTRAVLTATRYYPLLIVKR